MHKVLYIYNIVIFSFEKSNNQNYFIMKNLKKLSREEFKNLKGGSDKFIAPPDDGQCGGGACGEAGQTCGNVQNNCSCKIINNDPKWLRCVSA